MSTFEFVLIPLAIILGFAVSEVLKGWGQQVRSRHRRSSHLVQIASSAFILFFCMIYLWALWFLRDVAWSFPLFFLITLPGFAAALAAHISRVDTSTEAAPVLKQYFQNSRPVYSLLALFPISIITVSFIPGVREQVPDLPSLLTVTLLRLTLLGLILSLAWSKSLRYHAAALCLLWLVLIGLLVRIGILTKYVA